MIISEMSGPNDMKSVLSGSTGTGFSPVLVEPCYKDYLWGGTRIGEKYPGKNAPTSCAESWEISDRDDGMSRIASGPFSGTALAEILARYGEDIYGGAVSSPFPLLVKLIDARQRLSLQVHPNENTAGKTGSEPKTEIWYILDAEPGAYFYAGLKEHATRDAFAEALRNGRPESFLHRHQVESGDAFFIPGGCVHAIGEGCFLLEVQQNSDTTYRLWDWERVGPDGKERELHIEKAMETIDWHEDFAPRLTPRPLAEHAPAQAERLISSPFFVLDRFESAGEICLSTELSHFDIIFSARNSVALLPPADTGRPFEPVTIPEGRTCLVPAVTGDYRLVPCGGSCEVIRISPARGERSAVR